MFKTRRTKDKPFPVDAHRSPYIWGTVKNTNYVAHGPRTDTQDAADDSLAGSATSCAGQKAVAAVATP